MGLGGGRRLSNKRRATARSVVLKDAADLEFYFKSSRVDFVEVLQSDGSLVMRRRTMVVLEHPKPSRVMEQEVSPEARCTLEALEPYVINVEADKVYMFKLKEVDPKLEVQPVVDPLKID